MAALGDLITVCYRPRETMRRILDAPDRWGIQVVILAFVCSSANQVDTRTVSALLRTTMTSLMAIMALGLILGALLWVVGLLALSGIATVAGRLLGGTAAYKNVREALGWGMVPVIWSMVYRIPFAIVESRYDITPKGNQREDVLNLLAHGGCSMFVVFFVMQLVFAVWAFWVASACLAEAEGFSTPKGLGTLALSIAGPMIVIIAAVLSFHM